MGLRFPVVPYVLHIVVIFHDVDALFHEHDVLFGFQLLIVLGNQFDLNGEIPKMLAYQNFWMSVMAGAI